MKQIALALLICAAFTPLSFAEEASFQIFGVQFGDIKAEVKEKITKHFGLASFNKYHRYTIENGKYRILFKYDDIDEGLNRIQIYGTHFKAKEFRIRGKREWEDLSNLATEHLGEGFGSLPFLPHIKKGRNNFFKDWIRKNVRADLGIQLDEYGYYVELIIQDTKNTKHKAQSTK